MECDISIKEKTDSLDRLVVGKVYYDINKKNLVYDLMFPEKEQWIIKDSLIYNIINGEKKSVQKIPAINEFSVFHMLLTGSMPDYGLNFKDSPLKQTNVEKDGELIITKWEFIKTPIEGFEGYILTSKKNKLLNGVVIIGSDGVTIAGKQLFRKYINAGGLMVPTEIIQITYIDDKEYTRILTFRNIKINNFADEKNYDYHLPVN